MLRSPGTFVDVEPISASGALSTEPHRSTNMDEQMKQSDSDEQQHSNTVEEQESQGHPQKHTINRRQFLIITVIAGGVAGTGLLIGFNVFGRQGKAEKGASSSVVPVTSFAPN